MSNTPEQPPSLQDRFPHMQPVNSAPTLFTLNGCGLSMYGKRDHDLASNTYVKTYCLCLLFIPVLPLAAYRVADAERGWYFVGKEPLSRFSKTYRWWTVTVLIALLAVGGIRLYTTSDTYVAKKQLAEASAFLKSGEAAKAAKLYLKVSSSNLFLTEVQNGLKESLGLALQSKSPKDVEEAFRLIKNAPKKIQQTGPLVPNAFQLGLGRVNEFKAQDPEGALGVLDAVSQLEPDSPSLTPLQVELLESVVTSNPNSTNRIVELAIAYQNMKEVSRCKELLLTHKTKLGVTEGARILGQLLLAEGNYQGAYESLFPYVQTRLEQLRQAESAYTNATKRATDRAVDLLQQGKAPTAFYQQHKKASTEVQDRMVNEFITEQMERDPIYNRAIENLRSANQIVNVTLELGIVQLNRAQELKDPAARTAELEAAEKTFLAISGFAGETDEYRMFLGQVYYWLGRSAEGKELFDQLLTANNRSYKILTALATTLREVGDHAGARNLAEEAYKATTNTQEKFAAAAFRSLVEKDNDDQIAWLGKADPKDNWIQVSLNTARGEKALRDGDNQQAAVFLRNAVSAYEKMPKGPAVLNNGGLAFLRLYGATKDIRDHQRGMAWLEEAITMAPGDSTLLINTASTLLSSALMEVAGEFIQLETIGAVGDVTMLSHCFSDEAGRAAVFTKLRENSTFQKSQTYMDKAFLLSPKSTSLYQAQLVLEKCFRNLPEAKRLQQRVASAALDFTEVRQAMEEHISGVNDKKHLETFIKQIEKYEALLKLDRVQQHALTAEYVSATLNNMRQNAAIYGHISDPDAIIREAKAIHDKHSSTATRAGLQNAYFFAAHQELRRSNGAYNKLAEKSHRFLAPQYLFLVILEEGGPLAETVRTNAFVMKAIELERETQTLFPSLPHVADWALFKNVEPARAAAIATTLEKSEVAQTLAETEWSLEPLNTTTVLHHFWTLKMRGQPDKAAQLYQDAVRNGVPLPVL